MILLVALFALLSAVILWLVFVPVYMVVNTRAGIYSVSQTGTFAVSLHPGQIPLLHVNIFGFRVQQGGEKKTLEKAPVTRKRKRTSKKKSLDAWLFLIDGIMRGFKCKKIECTIDSGDVVLNAQLVPIMMLMSNSLVRMSVNFRNENEVNLVLLCRLNKILWTIIRFLTKK
jgi:hypothetical protein